MDLQELKSKLAGLATAKEAPLVWVDETAGMAPIPMPNHKAIINEKTNKVEAVTSKGYVIIQHKEAFAACIDALAAAKEGAKFKASVMEQGGRAWMTVVYEDAVANDGKSGIEIGVSISNSYDKTSSLKFGGSQGNYKQTGGEISVGFYGLRLACMNGMSVRIPIGDFTKINVVAKEQAKVGDIIEVGEREIDTREFEMEMTHAANGSIRHIGKNVQINLERLNQMIMALPQVAKLLEQKIAVAQKIAMTKEEADKRLEEIGFGETIRKRIMARFELEEANAWGLYNSITAYASHEEKVSPRSMERSLKRAEAGEGIRPVRASRPVWVSRPARASSRSSETSSPSMWSACG